MKQEHEERSLRIRTAMMGAFVLFTHLANLSTAKKAKMEISVKTNSLIRPFLLTALFICFFLQILNAQDQISESDLAQMRKAAQEHQANKQGLKYEIADVQVKGDQIMLKYDLNESGDAEYTVTTVFLREGDPLFKIIPKSVSGAIGRGQFAGKDNTIVWNYKNDYVKDLNGDDFYFILDIKRIERSSTPWTWIGLGGAAVAGGAAYFILRWQSKTNPASGEIPPLSIIRPN